MSVISKALVFSISKLLPMLSGLIATRIVYNELGQAYLGQYFLLMVLISTAPIFALGTLDYNYYKNIKALQQEEGSEKINVLPWAAVYGVYSIALTWIVPKIIQMTTGSFVATGGEFSLMDYSGALIGLSIILTYMTNVFQSISRYRLIFFGSALQSLIIVVMFIVRPGMNFQNGTPALYLALSYACAIIFYGMQMRDERRIALALTINRTSRHGAIYSISSMTTALLGLVFNYSDRLVALKILGIKSVSIIGAAQDVPLRVLQVLDSFSSIIMVHFKSEDRKNNSEYFQALSWMSIVTTSCVYLPLAFIMPSFLGIWFDQTLSEAAAPVSILFCGVCALKGPSVVYQAYFRAIGRPQIVTAVACSVAIVIGFGNYFFISKFDLRGVGASYVLSGCIGVFVYIATFLKVYVGAKPIRELMRSYGMQLMISIISFGAIAEIATSVVLDTLLELICVYCTLAMGAFLLFVFLDIIIWKENANLWLVRTKILVVSND